MKNKICLTVLALMMAMATWAQTKIVVLSDTHVMGPGLLVNDGAAWQNELAKDRKLLDYSQTHGGRNRSTVAAIPAHWAYNR